MGTPDFAVSTLERLMESEHEIVAVFTQPDKPVGRRQLFKPPSVKVKALEGDLDVYQPDSLKSEETKKLLNSLDVDVIVVVAYGKILPKEVLDIPRYGCINVHGSLLPKYRGASPIQTSILNGDRVTGVTTMYMSEGLDTGDIIDKAEIEIGDNETASELFERLAPIGAELLCQTLNKIETKTVKRTAQDDKLASYAPILTKQMAKIDFLDSAFNVHKKICGLSDWPCAYCYLKGKKLKVYHSCLADKFSGKPGELLDDRRMIIGCCDKAVEFIEIQLEGKKRIVAKDFLNGNQIKKGDILE